jgi:hypothetical protein
MCHGNPVIHVLISHLYYVNIYSIIVNIENIQYMAVAIAVSIETSRLAIATANNLGKGAGYDATTFGTLQ